MLNRIAIALSVATVVLLSPAVLQAQANRARRAKCANNLRQLSLGVIMYADDKRFFPHVKGLRENDGDVTTNHTPLAMRTLIYYGYLDAPEVFVCPSSYDGAPKNRMPEDQRAWFWGGNTLQDTQTRPFVSKVGDPPLNATTELSYGWSRRPMNNNVRSTALLLADRAVNEKAAVNTPLAGNHTDGWNVAHADASVQYLTVKNDPFPGSFLTDVEAKTGGFLALKVQKDAKAFAEPYDKPRTRPGKVEFPKRKTK